MLLRWKPIEALSIVELSLILYLLSSSDLVPTFACKLFLPYYPLVKLVTPFKLFYYFSKVDKEYT
jgi:hypothetical protein